MFWFSLAIAEEEKNETGALCHDKMYVSKIAQWWVTLLTSNQTVWVSNSFEAICKFVYGVTMRQKYDLLFLKTSIEQGNLLNDTIKDGKF